MDPYTLYVLIMNLPIIIMVIIAMVLCLVVNKKYYPVILFIAFILILLYPLIVTAIIKYKFKDYYRVLINHKELKSGDKWLFSLF